MDGAERRRGLAALRLGKTSGKTGKNEKSTKTKSNK